MPAADATSDSSSGLVCGTPYYYRLRSHRHGDAQYSIYSNLADAATQPCASVLLVDDDDDDPDVRSYYSSALGVLGLSYNTYNTVNSDSEPAAVALSSYSAVIWFTGDAYNPAAGPGAAGESALAAYLDSGGCLLLSSQDYISAHYSEGLTGFVANYLGVGLQTENAGQQFVFGDNPFFGLGPHTLFYPFGNYSDILVPAAGAKTAFQGSEGSAGVARDSGVYHSVYLAFPVEALPTALARQALIDRFMDFCAGTAPEDIFHAFLPVTARLTP